MLLNLKTNGENEFLLFLKLAKNKKREIAFVSVALNKKRGGYAVYFGTLESIDNARGIPMKPQDRRRHEELASFTRHPDIS